MTVTYSDKSFLRLLFRWKGSVWKDIYKDYIVFIVLYFIINAIYRFGLEGDSRLTFEKTVNFFHQWNQLIPIQFLIGFYVSSVFNRWWQQLNYVAWPDKLLIFVSANIQVESFVIAWQNSDMDEESVLIRKTFARYANLLNVLVWKEIAVKIKKRFPTDDHLAKAGLMTPEELTLFKNTTSPYGRWFVPVSWMNNLLARCRKEGRITDYTHQKMVEELYAFRGSSAMLTVFDWINIPLVYTQVVTLATYGYFGFCLIARQGLVPAADSRDIDIYVPLFTTLEFVFYIGWMKVGEDLRCPFGEDDEDFDMNYVLDRNIHVSNMIVDELHQQRPAPTTVPHYRLVYSFQQPKPETPEAQVGAWEQDVFTSKYPKLPHTEASWEVRDRVPAWRLSKLRIPDKKCCLHEDPDQSFTEGLHHRTGKGATLAKEEAVLLSEDESRALNDAHA